LPKEKIVATFFTMFVASSPGKSSLKYWSLRPGGVAVITFGGKSSDQILAGRKTVTLRKWPAPRVKVGEVYDAARIGYPPKKFARMKVTGLRRVKLREIDERLARRDGAESPTEVKAYWSKQGFGANDELWLVEFELI